MGRALSSGCSRHWTHPISVQQALAIDRIRHGSDQEKEQRVGIMRSAASGMTI
jgi:hypothetical protein